MNMCKKFRTPGSALTKMPSAKRRMVTSGKAQGNIGRSSEPAARSMAALQRRGTEKGGFAAGGVLRTDPGIRFVTLSAGS